MRQPFGVDADEAYERGVPITAILVCIGLVVYWALQTATKPMIIELATLIAIAIGLSIGFILCSYFVGLTATLVTRNLNR